MEIKVTSGHLKNARTKAVVSFVFQEDKIFSEEVLAIDKLLDGNISELKREIKFSGKDGEVLVVPTFGKLKFEYVVLIGAGSKRKANIDKARILGSTVVKQMKKMRVSRFLIDGEALLPIREPEDKIAQALVEGVILGNYSFDKYKSQKSEYKIKELQVRVKRRFKTAAEERVEVGKILAESQNFTRDLVNEPGNVITPVKLAEIAKEIAEEA